VSTRYTSDGRRLSSMTHAKRGHPCEFCADVPHGNGGQVSHGRRHVRAGQAIELVKDFPTYPPTSSRLFVDATDTERIERYRGNGYELVATAQHHEEKP
jgi:hypothetical protein